MSSLLQKNTATIQSLINKINTLPDAGGIELPELSNPATAEEVFANKELIDTNGNKIIGTFTIDNELTIQDNLIAQIQAAVDKLPEVDNNDSNNSNNVETCTIEVSTNTDFLVIYSTIDESGKITMAWTNDNSNTHSLTVICGSYIFVPVISTIPEYIINGNAEFIQTCAGYSAYRIMVFRIIGASSINCYDND